MAKTRSVLAEAQSLVAGPRRGAYGSARQNFARIARIVNELGLEAGGALTASDVAKVLIATKLARHAHAPKRDNLVDLCGYAELLSQVEEGRDA